MTTATEAQTHTLFVVDAHRDDGRRLVVRSDELLTAFLQIDRETDAQADRAIKTMPG